MQKNQPVVKVKSLMSANVIILLQVRVHETINNIKPFLLPTKQLCGRKCDGSIFHYWFKTSI